MERHHAVGRAPHGDGTLTRVCAPFGSGSAGEQLPPTAQLLHRVLDGADAAVPQLDYVRVPVPEVRDGNGSPCAASSGVTSARLSESGLPKRWMTWSAVIPSRF